MLIGGRHAVREALTSDKPVERLIMLENARDLSDFRSLAAKRGIPFDFVPRERLDALCQREGLDVHQGVALICAEFAYADADSLFSAENPFIVALDGVEDPHNLGAIIRTAEAAGVTGVVIPKRGSAGLTAGACKAAAGAAEHIPVARVPGIPAFLLECKERGLWVYGADADGESIYGVDFSGGCVLVLGAEGDGLARLTKERADKLVKIPTRGKTPSLNVSAAAAVIIFEICKKRWPV